MSYFTSPPAELEVSPDNDPVLSGAFADVNSSLRIVVTGLIAQFPLGGMTWDFMNYVLGLARLGHDVYYIEDNGQWPYNPNADGKIKSCDFNVNYLAEVMTRFGLEDRWAYRFGWKKQWFGMPESRLQELFRTADLLINVSGTIDKLEEYDRIRRRVYIDTDPVFTQLKLLRGHKYLRTLIDQHDVVFSFGECLPPSLLDTGDEWIGTRQPVVLSEWPVGSHHRPDYTTVMTWISYNPIEHEGKSYGQKDVEFMRFLDLPRRVAPVPLELAANSGMGRKLPRDLLVHKGWNLVDPLVVCLDLDGYRNYIQTSRAEWSVAKNGYVLGQSGWFSCRSACYLAAGRPVVLQETGFSRVLPVGKGILSFSTPEEAAACIQDIEADYDRHATAARTIAEDHFDSAKVLPRLLERAMSGNSGDSSGRTG